MWEASPDGDLIMNSQPHSKNLRLHRQVEPHGTFFITKCIEPRRPVLDSVARMVVCNAFADCVKCDRILVGAFAVMPGHWHAVFALMKNETIADFMESFMKFVSRRTMPGLRANDCGWQDGYRDTKIRSTKQLSHVCAYIEQNPVRKGLVATADEWKARSAHPKHQDFVTKPWPWEFPYDHR